MLVSRCSFSRIKSKLLACDATRVAAAFSSDASQVPNSSWPNCSSGLGGRLLAELERRAVARGAGHALLEVRSDNTAARALYARHGWHELHVRRRYYQPGDVDAIVLGKTLKREPLGENGVSHA